MATPTDGGKLWSGTLMDKYVKSTEEIMNEEEVKRFRSFAERYVIERASTFRTGDGELEDAWSCVERAKKAYGMIEDQARVAFARRNDVAAAAADGLTEEYKIWRANHVAKQQSLQQPSLQQQDLYQELAEQYKRSKLRSMPLSKKRSNQWS